jgi:hypothetical protein
MGTKEKKQFYNGYQPVTKANKSGSPPKDPNGIDWKEELGKVQDTLDKHYGDYYKEGGIEVIDFIKAKLTPIQYRGFLLGSIIKYSGRANFKDSFPEDVKKLAYYSNELLKVENEESEV